MALISCSECSREVSDKAPNCPNCGAPVASVMAEANAPTKVTFEDGKFVATKQLLAAHAVKAIQALNYKVDSVDEASGLIGFTTGMTWGSWSGVSGSIFLAEVAPSRFDVTGNAKQNVKGGQLLALDIGGEAKGKVAKVIDQMRRTAV